MPAFTFPSWRVFSIFAWTLVWSIVGIIAVFLDPTGHLYSWLARKGWSRQTLWIGGIVVSVKGHEKIDWNKLYVICANHESQVDIPLLFAHLPTGIRFLAKRSLFFIPVFGWMLLIAGFVPVDRTRRQKAHKSILKSSSRIRNGRSLLVFPEGTRSPDGFVHSFKSGAFLLAINAKVPVLPVAICGTYRIAPKDVLTVRPGSVQLIIGTPIPTVDLEPKDKDRLKKETQRIVETMHHTGEPM